MSLVDLNDLADPEGWLKEAKPKTLTNVTIIKVRDSEIALECIGDQIIVLEDKFKTGYECSACDGEGHTDNDCAFCKGTGKEAPDTLCRLCCAPNLYESGDYSPGKEVCPRCEGKGSVIIAPQISQRKPTSGVIKSVGPDVYPDNRVVNNVTGTKWAYPLKIGDRILYSQFAGTGIELKQKDFIRIMHAHEVMAKIYGAGKLGDFVK